MLVLAGNALSETPPTSRGYRILAGDVLQVDIVGKSDIAGQYTVNKDGDIQVPGLGGVPAAGRTITELGTDISRRISLISPKDIPQVNVSVVQAFRRKNYVLGAVLLPGVFSFAKSPTVWEAISEAGGPSEDADLSRVEIVSESQAPTTIDLATALQSSDLSTLPRLRAGDTVRVPRREGARGALGDLVYVFGAVGTGGSQPLDDCPDLVRAVMKSGPAADANLSDIEIVRKSGVRVVSMRVNLRAYLGKASLVGNPDLQSGDTIFLKRKDQSVSAWRIAGIALGIATSIVVLTNNL